jgi:ELWxxDGT repeat protein
MKNILPFFLLCFTHNFVSGQCTPTLFKDNFDVQYGVPFNNNLVLFCYDGVYQSDGTPNGTSILYPASPGVFANTATKPVLFNNSIYYSSKYYPTDPNLNPYAILCKTDGTDQGSIVVNSFPNSDAIKELTVVGDKLFFIVEFADFGNEKLWVTDGSVDAAVQVIDLDPSNDINRVPRKLIALNNKLLFWAGENITYRRHQYVTDGSEDGTSILLDLNDDEYGYNLGGYPAYSNGNVYFFNGTETANSGLWKTDGTTNGTTFIKRAEFVSNLTAANNQLFFSAYDADASSGNSLYGEEIWTSDGSESGTFMIKDIRPGNASSAATNGIIFKEFNNEVYFAANDGISGTEIWKTNGTAAGTVLVKDISFSNNSSMTAFRETVEYNGKLYFSAKDETHGNELWQTDGTNSGTTLVADLYEGTTGSNPTPLLTFNGNFYFRTYGDFEDKLWYCGDGSSAIQSTTENPIHLYPNPSKGKIRLSNLKNIVGKIELYSSIGQLVLSIEETNNHFVEIDLPNFPKGLYWFKFKTIEGDSQIKFVLE